MKPRGSPTSKPEDSDGHAGGSERSILRHFFLTKFWH